MRKHTGNLNIRAKPAQLALWRAAATAQGQTVSEFVRATVDEAARRDLGIGGKEVRPCA